MHSFSGGEEKHLGKFTQMHFLGRLKSASRLNRRASDFPGFGNASGWSKSKVFRQQIVRQFNNQSVVLDQTMTYKLSTIQMRV